MHKEFDPLQVTCFSLHVDGAMKKNMLRQSLYGFFFCDDELSFRFDCQSVLE